MLHLSRPALLQMVLPIWVEFSLGFVCHHLRSFDGSGNSSLTELDLLLSLEAFIIQSL